MFYICFDSKFQNRPPNVIFVENDVGGPVLESGFQNYINLVKTTIFGNFFEDYPNFVPIVGQNWDNIQGCFTETVPVPSIKDFP